MIRRSPLKRGGRIKPKKRKASEFQRIYGSKARVNFVAKLACAACGYAGTYPRQNAHGESGGMGRKADYDTILPLCGPCHTKQHGGGWLAIGMTAESVRRAAALTETLWQERGMGGDDTEG